MGEQNRGEGVVTTPSTGEGVVTTPSTGEGVVQQAAPLALVVDDTPGPHAPPANVDTIDRSTVAHGEDRSTVDTGRIAGGDSGHGPTAAPWTSAEIVAHIGKPGVAAAVTQLIREDAVDRDDRTARQMIDLLGESEARQLAEGILRALHELHELERPSLESTISSPPPALDGAAVPAATGEAAVGASSTEGAASTAGAATLGSPAPVASSETSAGQPAP